LLSIFGYPLLRAFGSLHNRQGRRWQQEDDMSDNGGNSTTGPMVLIADLAARFPEAFFVRGIQRRPLKIGTYHDIIAAAPDVDRKVLSRALFRYTNAFGYLGNLLEGAVRVGLDGNPAGVVDAGAAQHARMRFAAWLEHNRKKAAASAKPAAPAAPAAKERQQEGQSKGGKTKAGPGDKSKTKSSESKPNPQVADQLAAAAHVGGGTASNKLSLDALRAAARERKAAAVMRRA
jgi:sRNA-binding protein